MTYISMLPNELLCISFEYLELKTLVLVIPHVCRQWRKACQALGGVHLDFHRLWMWRDIPMEFIASLGVLFPRTERVTGSKMSDAGLIALANTCPGLEEVTLYGGWPLTDKALIALAKGCPKLTTVHFQRCDNLTDDALIALADNCRELTTVNFWDCEKLTDEALIALADKCGGLTSVNFWGCDRLTD